MTTPMDYSALANERIRVCHGPHCGPKGGARLYQKFCACAKEHGVEVSQIAPSGCMGHCTYGRNVMIDGMVRHRIDEDDVEVLLKQLPVTPVATVPVTINIDNLFDPFDTSY